MEIHTEILVEPLGYIQRANGLDKHLKNETALSIHRLHAWHRHAYGYILSCRRILPGHSGERNHSIGYQYPDAF